MIKKIVGKWNYYSGIIHDLLISHWLFFWLFYSNKQSNFFKTKIINEFFYGSSRLSHDFNQKNKIKLKEMFKTKVISKELVMLLYNYFLTFI